METAEEARTGLTREAETDYSDDVEREVNEEDIFHTILIGCSAVEPEA